VVRNPLYMPSIAELIERWTGSKEVLEARLRRLASGEWKGGKLSNLSGTPAQRKYLDPPLLEAEVGRQLRILWQVGSGPTEDGGYKQHIKSRNPSHYKPSVDYQLTGISLQYGGSSNLRM